MSLYIYLTLLSINIIFDITVFRTMAHSYCMECVCVCVYLCSGKILMFIPSLKVQLYFSHWSLLCPVFFFFFFHLLLWSLHLVRKIFNNFSTLHESHPCFALPLPPWVSGPFLLLVYIFQPNVLVSLRSNTCMLLTPPAQAFRSSQSSDWQVFS